MSRPRARMLARAGLDAAALECGAHWPIHQPSAQALARAGGAPSALHNNCSGKHAGFLCAACATGVDHRGYVAADASGAARGAARRSKASTGVGARRGRLRHRRLLGPDLGGAARPRWRTPSRASAPGAGLAPERAKAAARLRAACAAQPWLRRRHRALLHRDHAALRRARVRQDRRRGRVLRARCRSRASASRSNATTARRAPPR